MRTYNLNETFFSVWTQESAYVFGFLVADGNIFQTGPNSYIVSMTLKDSDRHILESINRLMGSNRPIKTIITKAGYVPGSIQHRLNLNSVQISHDLIVHG